VSVSATADGVLLTAHGTVERLDELPEFLLRIRHGRPAPAELVAELERRYTAIGGSPLLATTREQAAALARALGLPVFVGMRLFRPELDEALSEAARAGVRRLAVVPLAPFSVHVYAKAAEQARERLGLALSLVPVRPFGQSAEFLDAHIAAIAPFLTRAPDEQLLLTAHSLPVAVVRAGDPYADEVDASAWALAVRLGVDLSLAYQSQGVEGGDWLGPDLKSALIQAKNSGKSRVVVAPFGFVSEHVETLYDLDIEARGWAEGLGLEFLRVPALNATAGLVAALAAAARRALLG
jgi:ferrochelatase